MKFKHIAAAALVAVSGSAFAVGPGPLGTIDNLPMVIGNVVAPGIFQDLYNFSITNPGTLSAASLSRCVPDCASIASTRVVLPWST